MNTSDKGDVSEAKVISKLKEIGESVLLPFGDNERYDLVVDSNGEFIRVQVKTGRVTDGVVKFNTKGVLNNSSDYENKSYDKSEIDGFAVYCPEKGYYWVDVEEAGSSAMALRFEDCPDRSTINWAENYRLEDAFAGA